MKKMTKKVIRCVHKNHLWRWLVLLSIVVVSIIMLGKEESWKSVFVFGLEAATHGGGKMVRLLEED